ncbi:MAG: hypothetical protein KGL68_08925 [Burkholderiales bacterium]|nr:hypothetical protein [Burkholderiales bacterium]
MPAVKKVAARAATRKKTPARAAAKAAAPAPKPAAAAPAQKAPKADKAPKAEKSEKPKKPKLVRDSFTIPKNEYTALEDLKLRAAKLGRPAKKSEILRAGVMALAAMGDAAFLSSVGAVPAVKTGRPAKSDS